MRYNSNNKNVYKGVWRKERGQREGWIVRGEKEEGERKERVR
jgi:hypothetical protein